MMTIAHAALIVAEARSCWAALARTAPTFDQSVAYERLLHLDYLHGDDGPVCEPMPRAGRDELQRRAETSIERPSSSASSSGGPVESAAPSRWSRIETAVADLR